jgi:hypothetical protein
VTPKAAKNAIVQRYLDEFEGDFPIALPNQPFSPPVPGAGVVWVSLDVRLATGGQDSLGPIGGRRFLSGGVVLAQVSTTSGDATNLNDDTAKAALDLLDGVRLAGGLWTYGGRIVTAGTNGEWYQQNVIVNLQFEETR